MKSFKLLTWNILGPHAMDISDFKYKYPKVINWDYRFNLLIQKIISFNPDIICLQEVDIKNEKRFADALYEHGFCKSSYESRNEAGGVMVLHHNSKFELISKDSMQMTVQGTLGYPGASAWATLLCKQTQQKFVITSLHLFWESGKEQLDELFHALEPLSSLPIILAGDFNIPYIIMTHEIVPHIKKLNITKSKELCMFEHLSWTTQPPHNQDPNSWESLDHILFSKDFRIDLPNSFIADKQQRYLDRMVATSKLIINFNQESIPNDIFPSDHLPIIVSFNLPLHD